MLVDIGDLRDRPRGGRTPPELLRKQFDQLADKAVISFLARLAEDPPPMLSQIASKSPLPQREGAIPSGRHDLLGK